MRRDEREGPLVIYLVGKSSEQWSHPAEPGAVTKTMQRAGAIPFPGEMSLFRAEKAKMKDLQKLLVVLREWGIKQKMKFTY